MQKNNLILSRTFISCLAVFISSSYADTTTVYQNSNCPSGYSGPNGDCVVSSSPNTYSAYPENYDYPAVGGAAVNVDGYEGEDNYYTNFYNHPDNNYNHYYQDQNYGHDNQDGHYGNYGGYHHR